MVPAVGVPQTALQCRSVFTRAVGLARALAGPQESTSARLVSPVFAWP